MSIIAFLVLGIYTLALIYITIYCLMQLHLLYHYRKNKKSTTEPERATKAAVQEPALAAVDEATFSSAPKQEVEDMNSPWPFVTIQLPIYNELYVVERLIDNIARFDYPRDRFEIHILDDSTDETAELTRKKVTEYQAKGYQIEQIIRPVREGFKAGALRDAMPYASGEFIAIFDADFLPRPDFLKKTIPYFRDKEVGVVQTRWEHINRDYSLITKLQAIQLNVHFTVEQAGRMHGDYLLQFNGTAGVWRRKAIEEAGGWEADTLTEDLDLSIRTQLKGWKIHYLEKIGSPAELPAEMNSLKSQQFRWMKGGAETARKMLPTVWRSDLSLRQKIQATSHLLSSTVFLFVFLTGVFSVPLLFLLGELMETGFRMNYFGVFLIGLLSVSAVYYVANVVAVPQGDSFAKSFIKFLFLFPLFLALSMGLSLHNSIAVIQGYLGKQSPFVRTPKFNIQNLKDSFSRNKYVIRKLSWTTIFEGLLAIYFSAAVLGAIYLNNTSFIVFHLMLALGYGTIFYYSLRHLSVK